MLRGFKSVVECTPDKRKGDRSIRSRPKLTCFLFRLVVRTLNFRGKNMGSIPIRDFVCILFVNRLLMVSTFFYTIVFRSLIAYAAGLPRLYLFKDSKFLDIRLL